MLPKDIRDLIAPIEGERLAFHVHEPIVVGSGMAASVDSFLATVAELPAALEAHGIRDAVGMVVTATTPIDGVEARLSVEQLEGWVRQAGAMGAAEGGSAILVGYDPLRPESRIDAGDLGITDAAVFDWLREAGIPPLFTWDEVAAISANRGSPTASIYLVDGRAVFLHADVDWRNRLS